MQFFHPSIFITFGYFYQFWSILPIICIMKSQRLETNNQALLNFETSKRCCNVIKACLYSLSLRSAMQNHRQISYKLSKYESLL